MCSDGFVHIYSLPDLKLVGREDCVDASDAFGQRNFVVTSHGLFLHLRSPSEFTRGSFTEQARLNYNFSIPTKSTTAVASSAATRSMSREIVSDLPEVSTYWMISSVSANSLQLCFLPQLTEQHVHAPTY